MTRDDVVALLARRMEAADRRDWASLRKLYADDARTESPLSGSVHGPDAIVTALEAFYVAFPDAVIATQPPIVDGNRAVVPGEVTGTNAGGIMGLPPSGRSFRFKGVFIFVLRDNHIVEEHRIYDFTGMLVQIGALKAKPV